MSVTRRFLKRIRVARNLLRRRHDIILDGVPTSCDPHNLTFWEAAAAETWEPESFARLRELLKPAHVFADLGAWIGPITLFAARRCRQVYAFEPDTTAYRYLAWNLELNGLDNVLPFNLGLTTEDGPRRIASFRDGMGDSQSSLLAPDTSDGRDAMFLRFDTWLQLVKPPAIDVMKIDVEGSEFGLLTDIQGYLEEHRPALHLSTHAPYLPESERRVAVDALFDALRGYAGCSDESGSPLAPSEARDRALDGFHEFVFTP